MKKIFAYIGSSMGENSCTAMFAARILETVKERYEGEAEYEILTADRMKLDFCRGCCCCFRTCVCPQDKYDDMAAFKSKMLEADFIIWGSPVYAHQVSGQMKTVIDRLSYWLHLFALAGKPGIALCTTAGTGHMEVLAQLSKILYHLGIKAVGGYNVFSNLQGVFLQPQDMERKASTAAGVICDYLSGRKQVTSNPVFESYFAALKESILLSKEVKPGEYRFWKEMGYLDCGSFSELLEKWKPGPGQRR